jgi:hypothetical protein
MQLVWVDSQPFGGAGWCRASRLACAGSIPAFPTFFFLLFLWVGAGVLQLALGAFSLPAASLCNLSTSALLHSTVKCAALPRRSARYV